MLYCILLNGWIVRFVLISVLINLRKITELIRNVYRIWIDLENYDTRFDLDCGLEDTPANESTSEDRSVWTQVDFPGSQRDNRRDSCSRNTRSPSFRPGNEDASRRDFRPPTPQLSVRNVGRRPPTFGTESLPTVRLGFPTPPTEWYVGPAMYETWRPQPPSLATVWAAGFRFPPPPPPEYYVGPAWFHVNGPPPLPCCVAASLFNYPPPPMRPEVVTGSSNRL